MEKTTLKSYLQTTYSSTNWFQILKFIDDNRNLLTIYLEPRIRTSELTDQRSQSIFRAIKEVGTLKTTDGAVLPIFDVELENSVNIERNKVGVNSLLKNIMTRNAYRGILVTFHYPDEETQHSEWRFSFISKSGASDYFAEVEAQETNPKKYTYIFGTPEEHRTAIDRLYTLKQSRLRIDDFFDAFNVEPLSKGFFNEYKNYYEDFTTVVVEQYLHVFKHNRHLKEGATKTELGEYQKDVERDARNFVKRLLSRIVFLYFLQKKNWIGASNINYKDGDINFLENLFKGVYGQANQDEFYGKHLATLFFEALNLAKRPNDEYLLPNGTKKCIPFLNGGLFEEGQEPEGHREIKLPTYLFEELFKFFNGYNFTIYENSPQDHTMAVDPEMLGHIFENLLEDNKDKGAFYTPKEIVQYMTQESLIQYLSTSLPKLDKNDIENLVRNNVVNNLKDDLTEIDQIIDKVKICDPAIGSGAFPMGLLQEIFNIKALIHYHLGYEIWSPATVKQNIIQNSIYGVDIEIGAVDISRLRFWLSLVVDEDLPKPLPNLDYKIMQGDSLLESFKGIDLSKVSVGNNLTIAEVQRDIFGNILDNQMKMTIGKAGLSEKIQSKTKQYFTADNTLKPTLKNAIDQLIYEFIDYNIELRELQLQRLIADLDNNKQKGKFTAKQQKVYDGYLDDLKGLNSNKKELYELQSSVERPYFLWHLFFADVFENGGFDIVIGNPPYIQLQKNGGYLANLYKDEGFNVFCKTTDIYALFYEQGIKLLKGKGVLSYITSNKWMRSAYGEALRKFFIDNNPLRLIDMGAGIFDSATVDTNIILIEKSPFNDQLLVKYLDGKSDIHKLRASDFVIYENLSTDSWAVLSQTETDIKNQMSKIGLPLAQWDISIYRGVVTGYNDAYIISEKTRNRLVEEDINNEPILKPLLRGRDLKSYLPKWENTWLIFIPWHFPLHEDKSLAGSSSLAEEQFKYKYPVLYSFLLTYKDELESRNKAETGVRYEWYALQRCANTYHKEFTKEKIAWPSVGSTEYTLIERDNFLLDTNYFLVSNTQDSVERYLLGILNSKLIVKWINDEDTLVGTSAYRHYKNNMERLPIPILHGYKKEIMNRIVEYILFLKSSKEKINEYTTNDALASMFEEVIDAMVYELYFEDHLKELNLDVIDLVEQSLEHIAKLSQNDQINHLFKEWNEYDSELRNRIILQRTRSEYVATIEKALEK